MISITLIFVLFLWLVLFVLNHLKIMTLVCAMSLTMIMILNDYDSTIVTDGLTKLCTLIIMMAFALVMFNEIYHGDD